MHAGVIIYQRHIFPYYIQSGHQQEPLTVLG